MKLTAQQTELLEEIESDEPTETAVESLETAIGKFNYTASLLGALANWLRENDDGDGADLVLDFSNEMAEHEARSL